MQSVSSRGTQPKTNPVDTLRFETAAGLNVGCSRCQKSARYENKDGDGMCVCCMCWVSDSDKNCRERGREETTALRTMAGRTLTSVKKDPTKVEGAPTMIDPIRCINWWFRHIKAKRLHFWTVSKVLRVCIWVKDLLIKSRWSAFYVVYRNGQKGRIPLVQDLTSCASSCNLDSTFFYHHPL